MENIANNPPIWEAPNKPVNTGDYHCMCVQCDSAAGAYELVCEGTLRRSEHARNTGTIILKSAEMTTLCVGPSKTKYICHKALLAFNSEYFHGAFFSGFRGSKNPEHVLPDDDPAELEVFITWMYTGHIANSTVMCAKLWVLGNRLISPLFCNEVMHTLFTKHYQIRLTAEEVDYVVENTAEESKLRKYVKTLILTDGPLRGCKEENPRTAEFRDWLRLIEAGGPFIANIAAFHSFSKEGDFPDRPYFNGEHEHYLEPATARPMNDILAGRRRNTSLR
ncbi:hypothetical protein BJ878DRAFT_286807 [Calycina marina]|uniref:BTB domain-containing protein n=1 Tax=Calycina marina TaxID=1763456 RepID=A0A9P8CJA0_9HELO|nr:hypothetical protein BJ878DRAFT_286807 [Calycina marina]